MGAPSHLFYPPIVAQILMQSLTAERQVRIEGHFQSIYNCDGRINHSGTPGGILSHQPPRSLLFDVPVRVSNGLHRRLYARPEPASTYTVTRLGKSRLATPNECLIFWSKDAWIRHPSLEIALRKG